MEDFLKMDIFFAVATFAVLIVAALLSAFLFYCIRILRTLARIAEEVEGEAKALRGDIEEVRLKIRSEGVQAKHLLTLFKKATKRLLSQNRRKS